MNACAKSLSCVRLFVTLWTVALQAPLPMGFSTRTRECVAMPSSRGSSRPRDQTRVSYLLNWQTGSLPLAPAGKPEGTSFHCLISHPIIYFNGGQDAISSVYSGDVLRYNQSCNRIQGLLNKLVMGYPATFKETVSKEIATF